LWPRISDEGNEIEPKDTRTTTVYPDNGVMQVVPKTGGCMAIEPDPIRKSRRRAPYEKAHHV